MGKIFKDLQKFDKEKIEQTCLFNTRQKDTTGRKELFKEQRKEYGFDERETWALSYTSILWLYCHLKRYKDWGSIVAMDDENAHQYTLKIIKKDKNNNYMHDIIVDEDGYNKIKFKKEKITLPYGKIIDLICEYFEYFINYADDFDHEYLAHCLAGEGMKLYGKILPSLWW